MTSEPYIYLIISCFFYRSPSPFRQSRTVVTVFRMPTLIERAELSARSAHCKRVSCKVSEVGESIRPHKTNLSRVERFAGSGVCGSCLPAVATGVSCS